MSFPWTVFWKILEIPKNYPKKLFSVNLDLEKIHSRSAKFWYMISHTSRALNRMKLCTCLPYVIPQDYFLEDSGNIKKRSPKTFFSDNLDTQKFTHAHQSFGT